jgi:hypothetical protein
MLNRAGNGIPVDECVEELYAGDNMDITVEHKAIYSIIFYDTMSVIRDVGKKLSVRVIHG